MRPVVANVAEDIPKAWSGLYPGGTNMVGFDDSPNASSAALDELLDETDDAGADAAAAETETHQGVVVEVEEEEEVLDDDDGGFVFFFAAGMMVNSGGVKRTNERMNERDSSAPLL